jgi:hypothetical protein
MASKTNNHHTQQQSQPIKTTQAHAENSNLSAWAKARGGGGVH